MSDVGTSPRAVALEGGVSRDYLLHHRVCPTVITDDGSLVVAVAPDALVPEALDDLGLAYRRRDRRYRRQCVRPAGADHPDARS